MSDITKKFDDFKEEEKKKFDKTNSYEPLSNDIIALSKLDNGELVKIKGTVNITQITGVITDPSEIKDIEDTIKEGFTMDTSLIIKDTKIGQKIWLTCILEKSGSHGINSQSMGVVECRVLNTYKGLSKLNMLKR